MKALRRSFHRSFSKLVLAVACVVPLTAVRHAAGDTLNPVVRFTVWNTLSFDVELFRDQVPETVDNFLAYVDAGAYTNTIIHRSTTYLTPPENFNHVLQGGGFTKLFQFGGPEIGVVPAGSPIDLATTLLPNLKGTIAMARGDDINSATNQWFFNTKDNPGLDGGYAVFGQIVSGIGVLDDLAALNAYNVTLDVYADQSVVPTQFGDVPLYVEGQTPYLVTVTSIVAVPEPSSGALGGIGLAAAVWAARRRRAA